MLYAALLLLAAYLIGSIPFPVIVSRLVRGVDLREHGSGNMGAMNAARVLGKRWFPVVFGLDFLKGLGATYMVMRLLPGFLTAASLSVTPAEGAPLGSAVVGGLLVTPAVASALGGLIVVVGHCFPVFAGFKGGLGLAASAGAILLISPTLLAATILVILAVWALTRNMYVGVAVSALAFPLLGWRLVGENAAVAIFTVWGVMVFALHWPDLVAWRAELRR